MANNQINVEHDITRINSAIENLIVSGKTPHAYNINRYMVDAGDLDPIGRCRLLRDYSYLIAPVCRQFRVTKIVNALKVMRESNIMPSYAEVSRRVNIGYVQLKREYSPLIDKAIIDSYDVKQANEIKQLFNAMRRLANNNEFWLLTYNAISKEMGFTCSKSLKRHYGQIIEDYKTDITNKCNDKLKREAFKLHFNQIRVTQIELLKKTNLYRGHIRHNDEIKDLVSRLNDRLKSQFYIQINKAISLRKSKGLSINYHAIAKDLGTYATIIMRDCRAVEIINRHLK